MKRQRKLEEIFKKIAEWEKESPYNFCDRWCERCVHEKQMRCRLYKDEFEWNRIAERVFPGMIKGVQQGNRQGTRFAPVGYAYNKAKKLLEVEEREATKIVAQLIQNERFFRKDILQR